MLGDTVTVILELYLEKFTLYPKVAKSDQNFFGEILEEFINMHYIPGVSVELSTG